MLFLHNTVGPPLGKDITPNLTTVKHFFPPPIFGVRTGSGFTQMPQVASTHRRRLGIQPGVPVSFGIRVPLVIPPDADARNFDLIAVNQLVYFAERGVDVFHIRSW